jgi:predicted AAA+ superfamily ATPase
MLAKLRWFKEMMPSLAVIAAGSLLEFVLDDHEFSMPVGRISYLHLEPLSFDEFLAVRNPQMREFIKFILIKLMRYKPSSLCEPILMSLNVSPSIW